MSFFRDRRIQLRLMRRGGLTAAEAREAVGRLAGGTDWIGMRRPGDLVDQLREAKAYRRPEVRADALETIRAFCVDKFWHHGSWQGLP